MKAFQLFIGEHQCFNPFRLLLGWLVLQTAPCQGQVTESQITNGLIAFYPLDQLVPGTTNSTPDLVNRRDLTMYLGSLAGYMNGPAYIVAGSHPGMGNSTNVMNLSQSPSPTVLVYFSTGQNPLDGSGDFLPFINQRSATMNFWVKGNVPSSFDQRVMAECANNGDGNPFFSLSTQPASRNNNGLGYFLRENVPTTDTNGVTANQFSDGTYQTPAFYNEWDRFVQYTTNTIFDNSWHMVTTEIGTNGDVHVFVDGNYDPGNQSTPTVDHEGNAAIVPPIDVTNTYYVTNTYPFSTPPTNSPPPDGYVHWMVPGLNQAGASTAFGGFQRNGSLAGGPPVQMSDIAFWNRTLSPDEIRFVMTNGVPVCNEVDCSFCHPWITSFSVTPSTIHPGESVAVQWHVQAVTSKPIVSLFLNPAIDEVTNVTDYISGNGSTNLFVFTNTTFTLSLTNLNSCGYLQVQIPRAAGVTVVPLSFSGTSYLLSDPGNAKNPSFTMAWHSITNHTYTVQRKLGLTDPIWTTLTSGLPSGGSSTSFTDYTLGSSSSAFYRIVWP